MPKEPQAIVASAAKIHLSDPKPHRSENWQTYAWDYFDAIGEVKQTVYLVADALSAIDLFAGVRLPNGEVEPVDDPLADEALGLLGASDVTQIIKELAVQLQVPGDCYLLGLGPRADGRVLDPAPLPNEWMVLALDEVKVQGGQRAKVTLPATGQTVELQDEADYLHRIWRRHPRNGAKPDSHLRSILGPCEELLIIERMIRANSRSRLARNDLWLIPDELSFGAPDPTKSADEDPFIEELYDAILEPIHDESSAAAVAPIVIRGKGERLEQVRVVKDDRTTDSFLVGRTDGLLRRIAQGLPAPVEMVFGLGEANHWGAGQIERSAFRTYLEPLARALVGGLTEAFLRPVLAALGGRDDVIVWFRADRLVDDSTNVLDATRAYDRLLISAETARRSMGYRESDKPTEAEVAKRVSVEQERDRAPKPDPEAESITAALGDDLADVDARLLARLEAAADSALMRAVERAANRLRTLARKQPDAAALVAGKAASEVGPALGRAGITALASPTELLEGAWDHLRIQFERWCNEALEEALAAGGVELTVEEEAEATQARSDAWRWMAGEMTAVGVARLVGETPRDLTGIVREAIGRAGGATEAMAASAVREAFARVSLATGRIVRSALARSGWFTEGVRWEYGSAPRSNFPPHEAMDGREFASADDPEMTNPLGGYPGERVFPGDHRGCRCRLVPILRRAI